MYNIIYNFSDPPHFKMEWPCFIMVPGYMELPHKSKAWFIIIDTYIWNIQIAQKGR